MVVRTGVIRDPIHGDIPVSGVALAVINTVEFQRLRYIRQNALLHFVFPGAVHTRFAHSLGTMNVARRVIEVLFAPLREVAPDASAELDYVARVFELGALLHDVGHCAFSHSIEKVDVDNRPFLGSIGDLVHDWGAEEFFTAHFGPALMERKGIRLEEVRAMRLDHEALGAFFIRTIFSGDRVGVAAQQQLNVSGEVLGQDVNHLLENARPSQHLRDCVARIRPALVAACKANRCFGELAETEDFEGPFINALHTLISGTLDVDRLDYLQRDSYHCGVPYGRCEIDMLVRSLMLGGHAGEIAVGLRDKAVHCLEDMLWSRYQLFLQVLNHKTNVALNALFGQAIAEAHQDARIHRPRELRDFTSFTDDQVMANVFEFCIGGNLRRTTYSKALVHRQIPMQVDLMLDATETEEERRRDELAVKFEVETSKIIKGIGLSVFIKEGPAPVVVVRDRDSGRLSSRPAFSASPLLAQNRVPPTCRYAHFFVERPDNHTSPSTQEEAQ